MENRSPNRTTFGGLLPRVTAPIMAPQTLLRFHWPSEKHLTPRRCANCGARLIVDDIPTGTYQVVDVACLLCPVVACELVADGWRPPMTGEQFRALPAQQPKRGRPYKRPV